MKSKVNCLCNKVNGITVLSRKTFGDTELFLLLLSHFFNTHSTLLNRNHNSKSILPPRCCHDGEHLTFTWSMQVNSHGSARVAAVAYWLVAAAQTDRQIIPELMAVLSLRLTMGHHFSCVNMEMRTGIYTNAQNVSHLGDSRGFGG